MWELFQTSIFKNRVCLWCKTYVLKFWKAQIPVNEWISVIGESWCGLKSSEQGRYDIFSRSRVDALKSKNSNTMTQTFCFHVRTSKYHSLVRAGADPNIQIFLRYRTDILKLWKDVIYYLQANFSQWWKLVRTWTFRTRYIGMIYS